MKTYKTLKSKKELEVLFERDHEEGGSLNEEFFIQDDVNNVGAREEDFLDNYSLNKVKVEFQLDEDYPVIKWEFEPLRIIKALDENTYQSLYRQYVESGGVIKLITFDDQVVYTTPDCMSYLMESEFDGVDGMDLFRLYFEI